MSFSRISFRARSSAFTLVELMIVIAIIGVLASLITVGVMKALERGKMVSARIEISQLEAAVAAAKLDLGNMEALPSRMRIAFSVPAFTSATALAGESAADVNLRLATWNVFQKAFGRTITGTGTPPVFSWRGPGNAPNAGTPAITLEGMECLMFWLGGLVEGGKFTGFAASRSDPTLSETASSKRKGPYYEFETGRVTGSAASGKLGYANSYSGPYVYFSNGEYAHYTLNPLGGLTPFRNSNTTTANSFYNAKTFQIISSGQDQTFGSGGFYQPPLALGSPGYDDLSNFSSNLLGKKDE